MPSLYDRVAGQSVEPLAALSDGIFAVSMTLLVLDLRVPAEAPRSCTLLFRHLLQHRRHHARANQLRHRPKILLEIILAETRGIARHGAFVMLSVSLWRLGAALTTRRVAVR